ncbi:helix-turn-helix domain-containing protein [Duganella sp. Dugasp56]|jgi:HTH-type transcriptional regulator/antitoxin HipB|uniref:helix-turn-helix domain-containing protein n=1 Tax=Duganella sp. Dugasp56 TaxID=3243046 RepID=UPI0039AF4BB9
MQFPLQTIDQLKPLVQGFRKRAGLTQAAMAEKLGITQQSYAQMESNLGSTSVERLYTIMRLLDVQLSFLPSDGEVATKPSKANKIKSAMTGPQEVKQSDKTKW